MPTHFLTSASTFSSKETNITGHLILHQLKLTKNDNLTKNYENSSKQHA